MQWTMSLDFTVRYQRTPGAQYHVRPLSLLQQEIMYRCDGSVTVADQPTAPLPGRQRRGWPSLNEKLRGWQDWLWERRTWDVQVRQEYRRRWRGNPRRRVWWPQTHRRGFNHLLPGGAPGRRGPSLAPAAAWRCAGR